jgi:GntR family transcriptional regulator/MocR family aminotransferase
LVADVAAAKVTDDRGSPVLDQLTFADFVAHGEFDRHLRRMRPRCRRLRDTLISTLAQRLPGLRPTGVSAGLHVLTWLPADLGETVVVEAAARRGLGVYGLAPYWVADGAAGLVFGYGALTESTVVAGIDLLGQTTTELR